MKRRIHLLFIISILVISSLYAQAIPTDSLYLGQIPPGNIPKVFNLPVSSGSFAAERIAISDDGEEIYYSVVHSYYPTAGDTIKYFRYSGNKWTGPFNIFQGYIAPRLSITGDTMYFQNNSVNYQTLFSVRSGESWSNPRRILNNLNSAHYFQETGNGNYYVSSISNPSIGSNDWCKLLINGTDTSAISLGLPLNTLKQDLDFFMSKDESFMIMAKYSGYTTSLYISYHKNNGGWTNPKSLGPTINFGLGAWGPFVTTDNKYLFYTSGTKPDYSDTYVYWVRIDSLIDSLMLMNFVPYLNYKIPSQSIQTGQLFTYIMPDNTFIDDDGNSTLTYSATLSNGNPLPTWLSFNPDTRTFTGTPTEAIDINVRIKATDRANVSISCTFAINVTITGLEDTKGQIPKNINLYQNYPNPFNPTTTIEFAIPKTGRYSLSLYNPLGELVKEISNREYEAGYYKETFNAAGMSSGMYIYRLTGNYANIVRKMVLLR